MHRPRSYAPAAAEPGWRRSPGLGAKTEEKVLEQLARPKAEVDRETLLGQGLARRRASVAELRAHPAAERVSEAGSVRRRGETVQDLDMIATASDPAALTRVRRPALGRRGRRPGGRRRPWSPRTASCSTSASRPLRATAASSSTSPARPRTTSPCARRRSRAACPSPSTASRTSRRTRWSAPRARRSCTPCSVTVDPTRAAREPSSSRPRAEARSPGSSGWRRSWATSIPHQLVGRPATLEEMVGAAAAPRPSLPRGLRSRKRLKDGRLERQAERIAVLSKRVGGLEILSGSRWTSAPTDPSTYLTRLWRSAPG